MKTTFVIVKKYTENMLDSTCPICLASSEEEAKAICEKLTEADTSLKVKDGASWGSSWYEYWTLPTAEEAIEALKNEEPWIDYRG